MKPSMHPLLKSTMLLLLIAIGYTNHLMGQVAYILGDQQSFTNTQVTSTSGTSSQDIDVFFPGLPHTPAFETRFEESYLEIRLNTGDLHDLPNVTFSVDIDLSAGFTANTGGTTPSNISSISLHIDETNPEDIYRIPFSSNEVFDTEKATVTLNSSSTTISGLSATQQQDLELVAEFKTQQHSKAQYSPNPSSTVLGVLAPTITTGSNRVVFDWVLATGIEMISNYEIQILRLHNIDGTSTVPQDVQAVVDWNKALSIETQSRETSITLSIMEGTGYYLWRVRPIGSYYEGGFGNDDNWGIWSSSANQGATLNFSGGSVVSSSGQFYFTQPDSDKNWFYQRSFSNGSYQDDEQIRMGEGITFANGLNQVDQTQVRIASNNEIGITENIRDYTGRNAWSGMMVPISGKDDLTFESSFTEYSTGVNYGPEHFDGGLNYLAPSQVLSSSGSNYSYYSDNNSDNRIPDAEGYPFSRTRYMNDGTGRPKQTGAPGNTFRIYEDNDPDDRSTRYFYSGVADAELIRVFGDEAPLGESTSKVLVQDANRVLTVTYKDKSGQTLATCLSSTGANNYNDSSSPLDGLASQEDAAFNVPDSIKAKQPLGNYGIISSKTLVFTEPSTISVNYELDVATIEDLCSDYCSTCDYEVHVQVKDVESTDIVDEQSLSLPPDLCSNAATQSLSFSVSVQPGTYQFSKVIKVNNWNAAENKSNLSYHQQTISDYYDDLIYQAPLEDIWSTLDPNAPDLANFYNLLGVDINIPNAFQTFIDSSAIIEIGCDTFEIPIETCPTYDCGESSIEGFVNYFIDYWSDEAFIDPNGVDKLPFLNEEYTEEEFEQMILNMVEDGYDCEQLWECWMALTDSYTYMVSQSGTWNGSLSQGYTGTSSSGSPFTTSPMFGGVTADYDLVDQFLNCVGYQYQGVTDVDFGSNGGVLDGAGSPGYLSHAYAYFNYTWGDNIYCENYFCPGAGDMIDCADQINSGTNPDSVWQAFAGCVQNSILPTGGAVGGVSVNTTIQQQINDMQTNCEDICEGRRASFREAAINEFHRNNMYVEGDLYVLVPDTVYDVPTYVPDQTEPLGNFSSWDITAQNLECLVDSLVNLCKDGCDDLEIQYDGSGNPVGMGTTAAFDAMTQSMMWAYDLKLADPDCEAGYQTISPSTTPSNSPAVQMANQWTQWLNGGGGTYGQGQLPSGTGANVLGGGYQILSGNYTILINPTTGTFQVYATGTNTTTIVQNHPFVNGLNNYFTNYYNYEIGNYSWLPCTPNVAEADEFWLTGMRASQQLDLNQDYIYLNNGIDQISSFFEDRNMNDGQFGETKVYQFPTTGGPLGVSVSSTPMLVNRRVILDYIPDNTLHFGVDNPCLTIANGRIPVVYYYGCFSPAVGDTLQHINPESVSSGWWDDGLPQFIQNDSGYLSFINPTNPLDTCILPDVRFVTSDSLIWDTNWTAGYDTSLVNPYGTFVYDDGTGFINFIAPNGDTIPIVPFDFGTSEPCEYPNMCFQWLQPIAQFEATDTVEALSCEIATAITIRNQIEALLADAKEDAVAAITQQYNTNCANPKNVSDRFWLDYTLKYHHYTLYYYDRAGRLIKTVPPEGVDFLSTTNSNVLNRQVSPSHRMVTAYNYNSRTQLSAQNTPDGGSSNFWYDGNNQLRFSQNAQQVIDKEYSYTKYDELGRIIETGVSDAGIASLSNYTDVITWPTSNNSEQTWTYYDIPASGITYQGVAQEFLNHRVSYTTNHLGHKTYYSYDPHGNVKWLIQFISGLGQFSVAYEYDLYTNSVLEVAYQEGKLDQFFHRYTYDADNRIIQTETSIDGVIWDKDAGYEYYHHGPLARTEIGEDQLQGTDYLYTLQGWLKGINDPSLTFNDDGKDGLLGGANESTARDAFGMALTYYNGDFDRSTHPLGYTNATVQAKAADANRDLYNGNISSISYKREASIDPEPYLSYQYRYDEVQRLKEATFNQKSGSSWAMDATRLSSTYSYDANGNLERLSRYNNTSGTLMDNLNYFYPTSSNEKINNRLDYVKDVAAAGVASNDIDAQSAGNYSYDAIGNMTKDVSENINYIGWYANGKVRLILYSDDHSDLEFEYDAMGNRVKKIEKTKDSSGITLDSDEWNVTYYVRDAQGNVMGTYNRTYNGEDHFYHLIEQPIYGASRVGLRKENIEIYSETAGTSGGGSGNYVATNTAERDLGMKQYELTDHLGNVRVVIGDERELTGFDDATALDFGDAHYAPVDLYFDNTTPIPELTVEAWVNTTYSNPSGTSFENWSILDFDRSDYFTVSIDHIGRVYFASRGVGSSIDDFYGSGQVNDGQWHHIAAVYNGTNKYIYIDGVLDSVKTNVTHAGADIGWTSTRYGYIGTGSEASAFKGGRNNVYYDGMIDELRLWTTVRTPAELNANMHSSLLGTEPSLLAYWPMNDGAGQTITDATGNGHHAYLGSDTSSVDAQDPSWVTGVSSSGVKAKVLASMDYYPFGMELDGRTYNSPDYRYGFNGMEKDDEVKGSGNSLDFGARIYDSRVGRWLSIDPLQAKFPFTSPYNFALNTPIQAIDPDGRDVIFVNGYRMGKSSDSDRGRSSKEQLERRNNYWNNANTDFTTSVGSYFNDNKHHFLNASFGAGSPASERMTSGYFTALEMIKSGEIILDANTPITLVGHSQGNAFAAGMAEAIKDVAWQKEIEVDVNLVMLSVHQPEDIKVPSDINAIQFTYNNDNSMFVSPMAIEGKEVQGVLNANSENVDWWQGDGLDAHSATVDDDAAFETIKTVDKTHKEFKKKGDN